MSKNNYFYVVVDYYNNELHKYQCIRVTSADNLANRGYHNITIFKTKNEACKIAQFWNYCAIENNNSELDKQIPAQNWIRHELNDNGVDEIIFDYRIAHDIKISFNMDELAKRFFEEYDGRKIYKNEIKDYVGDFIYEYTKDTGIMNIASYYRCYEGLQFNFDEYNRTHDDKLLNELNDAFSIHLLYNYCYTGYGIINDIA